MCQSQTKKTKKNRLNSVWWKAWMQKPFLEVCSKEQSKQKSSQWDKYNLKCETGYEKVENKRR